MEKSFATLPVFNTFRCLYVTSFLIQVFFCVRCASFSLFSLASNPTDRQTKTNILVHRLVSTVVDLIMDLYILAPTCMKKVKVKETESQEADEMNQDIDSRDKVMHI